MAALILNRQKSQDKTLCGVIISLLNAIATYKTAEIMYAELEAETDPAG
jgi:hypothetical protein